MESRPVNDDVVNRLIGFCQRNLGEAEGLFNRLTAEKNRPVNLAGEELMLGESECAEFVERFSAEVAPRLWESKRRKDQI